MKTLADLLVGLRQLFGWRSAPRQSPRSLRDHNDSKSNQCRDLNKYAPSAERLAEMQTIADARTIKDRTSQSEKELERKSQGVSEARYCRQLSDELAAPRSRGCAKTSHATMRNTTRHDRQRQGKDDRSHRSPQWQIKHILVKVICFQKKAPLTAHV
jgi:hypothetical protein